jgi:hypothetical protein
LESFGINHEEWIDKRFADEDRKRRERARKKSTTDNIERQDDVETSEDLNDDEQADDDDCSMDTGQGPVANDIILEQTFTEKV